MITNKRSAGGVLYRNNNETIEVYMLQHQQYGLVLPKGGLEGAETWTEAAIREIREETGFEVLSPVFSITPILYSFEKDGNTFKKEVHFFIFEITSDQPRHAMKLESGEKLEDGGWYDIDTAIATNAHETEKNVLREAHALLIR